jgi:heme-degrading monooxygenase HmoA
MAHPQHARIGFYTAQPGTLDAALARARAELVPVIQGEPGFRRYTALRTGTDTLISLSGWDTASQAEAAAQNLSYWVRKVLGPAIVAMENYVAAITTFLETPDASLAYGRVTDIQFQPGRAEEIRARAQTDFLPLLQAQPGLVRYVAFRVSEDRIMTLTAFASREAMEAAEEATTQWRETVRPLAVSMQRHAGDVVWAVRKD